MNKFLQPDECLVRDGFTACRAPDGTLLPAVQQYIIVSVDEADPADVVEVGENECLVHGGQVFTDRKRAEERFAALKAGRKPPLREVGTPLYLIEEAANIDPKTGHTFESKKNMQTLSNKFAEIFIMQMRKEEELAKQDEKTANLLPCVPP